MKKNRREVMLFVRSYRRLRRVIHENRGAEAERDRWYNELRSVYELLPESLRTRAWMLTSVEWAA